MHAANLAVVLPLRAGTGHGQLRSLSSRAYELLLACLEAAFLRPLFDRQLQLHDEQPRSPELIGVQY